MSTKTIDVSEAQQHFAELVSQVVAGTEVTVTKDGTPVVRLVPVVAPTTSRVAGLHPGAIWTSADFDEPLPEEFWTGTA